MFGDGHILELQGDFEILLYPWIVGYNGAGGVIDWLIINGGYILWLNLHNIKSRVSMNCDGFKIVPGID